LTGIICIWSGSIASIPAGWALCDGTNGTPDLRDRFVPGAGGTEPPGTIGGSASHTHDITTDDTTTHLQDGPVIKYDYPYGNYYRTCYAHHHLGTSGPSLNIPPSYALAYIMHL